MERNRGEAVDRGGGAGCNNAAGHAGGADLRETETQRWLWTTAVAMVGEAPSLTWEFVEKCAREEQVSCIIPSLAPPPQAAPQRSKEGCPALVTT